MKLLNGITINGDPLGLDWSRKKVTVFDPRIAGKNKIRNFKRFEDVAREYPGCTLFFEATTESFVLERREEVIQALKNAGIDAWTFNPKLTAQYRKEHDLEKSDAKDAEVIFLIATTTKKTLKRFGSLRRDDTLGKEISQWTIADRAQHDCEKSFAVAEKYFGKYPRLKTKRMAATHAPAEFEQFIFDAQMKYRKPIGKILHVADEVRRYGLEHNGVDGGKDTFRRQIGNYSNGYKRIMRSEVNHWLVGEVTKARVKDAGAKGQPVDEKTIRKQVFKESQKFLDYLWHLTAAPVKVSETLFNSVASS